eukprot:CAMPEP_0201948778 /NCGR_PEP_ID=MMETSP0903-20130614/55639_1 /ASSEMBLY_ACC=CAM_ASM_000552 /TAXON_ID=420261 /ORGANISM="Thalassiosira antarctica, Strain CCMP982" /LENGTH=290 /DNA_ID=CAMNT_0048491973 /DNA_START=54 /DNA_END=922 /DNA_ORIENTATION=+
MSHPQQQQQSEQQPPRRRAPGILRLLPETLPFYTYYEYLRNNKQRRLQTIKQQDLDVESVQLNATDADVADNNEIMRIIFKGDHQADMIPNAPLHWTCDEKKILLKKAAGFTLFFFVDSTNRQSLLAMPLVSQWFHHALNDDRDESSGNRVICIPNHPGPKEINLRNSNSDPIIQATINSSITSAAKQQILAMLINTGFYHLPFLHPTRLSLLHLLGATRVPCVIVVSNDTGRIVTRYGWEGIKREMGTLEQWIESNSIENKSCYGDKLDRVDTDEGSTPHFESQVVKEW